MNKGSLAAVAAELEPFFAADGKKRQQDAGKEHGRGQRHFRKKFRKRRRATGQNRLRKKFLNRCRTLRRMQSGGSRGSQRPNLFRQKCRNKSLRQKFLKLRRATGQKVVAKMPQPMPRQPQARDRAESVVEKIPQQMPLGNRFTMPAAMAAWRTAPRRSPSGNASSRACSSAGSSPDATAF